MYVESDHLQEWIESGRASVLPVEVSGRFDEYLCSLPWLPARLDWRQIPYAVFDYQDAAWSGEEALDWARGLGFMEFDDALIMYSASEPGILCSVRDAFFELDFLTMGRVHPAYICGARRVGGEIDFDFSRFAEWDGFSVLTSRSP